ncbi:uncharacterized protein ARMOST_14631 [Armillaria ostoyae]|uniref:Uncharacterized protein n=1 Tax=Armillaria ostoyae TaxID=47428 RepID=A0A284RR81_ARMOS|nr:uncharacterized protein ARMOST_14631 [Armillaria ostoyae]
MGLVRIVAGLFKVSESAVQQEIDQMKSIDTDKAVLTDLKVYLKNINAGLYGRGDVPLGCIPQRLQKSGQQRTQGFFLLHLHYHTERLSDIYGNLFNVVLPSLYHVMDALLFMDELDNLLTTSLIASIFVCSQANTSSHARQRACTIPSPQRSSVDGVLPRRNRFPAEFVAMLQKREEMGTTESKEYQAGATTLMKYYSRMLYRLLKRT